MGMFKPVPIVELEGIENVTSMAYQEKPTPTLLLGTSAGLVHAYGMNGSPYPEDLCNSGEFRNKLQLSGKPIEQLSVAEENTAYALTDGNLSHFQSTLTKVGSVIARGVTAFCFHEDRGSWAICATTIKKKALLFINKGQRYEVFKELSIPDTALKVTWAKNWITFAFRKDFSVMNENDGSLREIFKFPSESTFLPLMKQLPDEELILLFQEKVAIFYNQKTQEPSHKNNLRWPHGVQHLALAAPYVLGFSQGRFDVFSLRDQSLRYSQKAQTFNDIAFVADNNDRIFVASQGSIWCLARVPFEQQMEKLLKQVRTIPDARELLNANFDPDDPQRTKALANFHIRAAWTFFNHLQFPQAFQHFSFSPDFDRQELMQYWQHYLTDDVQAEGGIEAFIRRRLAEDSDDPTKEIDPSVVRSSLQLANDSMARFSVKQRQALQARLHSDAGGEEEIRTLDTVVLKLLVESGDDQWRELDPIYCQVDDVRNFLVSKGRCDALAWLLNMTGDVEAALQEWAALMVPGEVSTILQKSIREKHPKQKFFLSTYVPKLLLMGTEGPVKAVEVFTSTSEWALEPLDILELLKPDNWASLTFLEHVTAKKDDKRLSTELAWWYLNNPGDPERLLHFLEEAKSLDTESIVGRLGSDQPRERVALYRLDGRHNDALHILVRDLKDFVRAEIYCHCEPWGASVFSPPEWVKSLAFTMPSNGGKWEYDVPRPPGTEPKYAGHLFIFLQELLDLPDEDAAVGRLLETFAVHPDLHPTKVLPVLPSTLKLNLLTPYLRNCFKHYLHEQRLTSVQSKLSSMSFLQTFKTMAHLKQRDVSMTEDRACPFCHKRILDREFAAMPGPDGACAHVQCAARAAPE